MSRSLHAAIIMLALPVIAGCGTLHTGYRDLDRSFNSAQVASEKPARCCLVSGLIAAFGWFWYKNDGTIEYDPNAPAGEKVSLGFQEPAADSTQLGANP